MYCITIYIFIHVIHISLLKQFVDSNLSLLFIRASISSRVCFHQHLTFSRNETVSTLHTPPPPTSVISFSLSFISSTSVSSPFIGLSVSPFCFPPFSCLRLSSSLPNFPFSSLSCLICPVTLLYPSLPPYPLSFFLSSLSLLSLTHS